MGIFDRKQPEENIEDDDSLEKDLLELRRIRKQRLAGQKKRREPPKPWGKKERLIVGLTLLVTVLFSAIFSLTARGWKLPGMKRIKLPSLNIFKEETIDLGEKKTISDQELYQSEKIINLFSEETKKLTGVYAFTLVNLDNEFSFGVNEDEVMEAASLIKLPVMALSYKQAEEGKLNLDEEYLLKATDKVGGSGSLSGKPVGYILSYRKILILMGKESDNTAFKIMRDRLGDKAIDVFTQSLGMKDTEIKNNQTSAEDVAVFFRDLYKGKILNQVNTEALLGSLTETIYEDVIPKGVGVGIKVSHKYGREVGVLNDAGIIYSAKPFVLVLLSKATVGKEPETFFPDFAKNVFAVWTD